MAAATRAEGESQARVIKSTADRERAAVIAVAEADAARQIGEGEARAARIASEAQAADPAFYQFLKTLETYRVALDSKTTLVLSADSHFLRLLTQGHLLPPTDKPAAPSPSLSSSGSGLPVAAQTRTVPVTGALQTGGARGLDPRAASGSGQGDKP